MRGDSFHKPKEQMAILPSDGFKIDHESVVYYNGMLTNRESAIGIRDGISEDYGGAQVVLFFNPTRGFMNDLLTCALLKCGIKTAYESMCAEHFKNTLSEDPIHHFHVIANSQGCTRLNNTGSLLSEDQRQHFTVDAYGPATIIDDSRFGRVKNYLSPLDGVPITSTWNYAKNVVGFDSNVTFLSPHTKNPLTEHYLLGDTYRAQIEKNGREFVEQYVGN